METPVSLLFLPGFLVSRASGLKRRARQAREQKDASLTDILPSLFRTFIYYDEATASLLLRHDVAHAIVAFIEVLQHVLLLFDTIIDVSIVVGQR